MKNCLYSLTVASMLIFIIGVSQNAVGQNPASTIKKIFIDPSNASGGSVSQLFDSVRYVPLENRNDLVVGQISNLRVSRHYFVFTDYNTKSIYVFDKLGKFKSRISSVPMTGWIADNDFWRIAESFVINPTSEQIYITYNDHDKNLKKYVAVFDPENGQLISKKLMPNLMQDMSAQFVFLPNGNQLFAYTLPSEQKMHWNEKFYFYEIHNFDSIVKGIIPYDPKDPLTPRDWDCWYHYDSNDGDISLWNRGGDYAFYRIKNDIPSKYTIVQPAELSLDSLYYQDPNALKSIENTMAFYRQYKDRTNGIAYLKSTGNYISFVLNKSSFYTSFDNYVYASQSNMLYSWGHISPDSLSYFLPVNVSFIEAMSEDHVYSVMPSYILFQSKNNLTDKSWEHSPVLKEYFTNQTRKSNPVIVELKLKDDLCGRKYHFL